MKTRTGYRIILNAETGLSGHEIVGRAYHPKDGTCRTVRAATLGEVLSDLEYFGYYLPAYHVAGEESEAANV